MLLLGLPGGLQVDVGFSCREAIGSSKRNTSPTSGIGFIVPTYDIRQLSTEYSSAINPRIGTPSETTTVKAYGQG